MKNGLFLAAAILFEVFGTTMLKLSNGFTVLFPSLGVIVGFLISFSFFGLALRGIALSTAYAIWSGIGTALTACVGIILFAEGIGLLKVVALLLIIAGVVILNKSNADPTKEQYAETIVGASK